MERTSLVGTGRSMMPTLPERCLLAVVRVPFAEIRTGSGDGDIIATRVNGVTVTHRAIARLEDGSVVTQGDNNARADPVVTTEQNYLGVVVGFEKPGTVGELVALRIEPDGGNGEDAEFDDSPRGHPRPAMGTHRKWR